MNRSLGYEPRSFKGNNKEWFMRVIPSISAENQPIVGQGTLQGSIQVIWLTTLAKCLFVGRHTKYTSTTRKYCAFRRGVWKYFREAKWIENLWQELHGPTGDVRLVRQAGAWAGHPQVTVRPREVAHVEIGTERNLQ